MKLLTFAEENLAPPRFPSLKDSGLTETEVVRLRNMYIRRIANWRKLAKAESWNERAQSKIYSCIRAERAKLAKLPRIEGQE